MRPLILTLLCLSVLAQAQESEQFPFIGLSVSTQTIGFSDRNNTKGFDDTQTGISLRYGKQTQEWRTVFELNYHTDAYIGVSVEVDKILFDEMFGTPKLRPYFGMTAGYMYFDNLDDVPLKPGETQDDLEQNGYYLGGTFGFIIYASDTVDVDISYHYYKIENLDYLDNMHGAEFAVHYFF
jgi:hypothetical protein